MPRQRGTSGSKDHGAGLKFAHPLVAQHQKERLSRQALGKLVAVISCPRMHHLARAQLVTLSRGVRQEQVQRGFVASLTQRLQGQAHGAGAPRRVGHLNDSVRTFSHLLAA